MKITPLVIHGGMILPRHTARFSDPVNVTSLVVTQGGQTVLTMAEPHGLPVGTLDTLSITDADTPNAVTSATVDGDGNVVLVTQYPHRLTTTPDPSLFDPFNALVKLGGFASSLINGNRQLVSVPDRNTLVILPGGTVTGPITLTGTERLLERLERELVGWHKVTATGPSTVSFPTPTAVSRSYTAASPVVVRNIRIWGALDYDMALSHFTALDLEATVNRPVMYILPHPVERRGGDEILVEGADNRMLIDDGFTVLVLIPGHDTAAHVAAIDMAQGELWTAVRRTFHGLKIQRSEYCEPGNYLASFRSHNGGITKGNRAIYAHEYVFMMPAEIVSSDGISPFEWSQIDDSGEVPTSIYPADPPPFRDLDITGILRHGQPSPLTGTFTINEES